MKLYVGNLSYSLTEDELKEVFQPFGQIASVNIIKDKFTGKSRGFGFVEMVNKNEALDAIANLNGQKVNGLRIRVNESLPKTQQPRFSKPPRRQQ